MRAYNYNILRIYVANYFSCLSCTSCTGNLRDIPPLPRQCARSDRSATSGHTYTVVNFWSHLEQTKMQRSHSMISSQCTSKPRSKRIRPAELALCSLLVRSTYDTAYYFGGFFQIIPFALVPSFLQLRLGRTMEDHPDHHYHSPIQDTKYGIYRAVRRKATIHFQCRYSDDLIQDIAREMRDTRAYMSERISLRYWEHELNTCATTLTVTYGLDC